MEKKRFGWAGKILWVDLTKRKITTYPTSDFEYRIKIKCNIDSEPIINYYCDIFNQIDTY